MSANVADSGRPGCLVVLSGPSGAGKSTVCKAVQNVLPRLHFSVSCTTRDPREGETEGVDYHFVSPDEFLRRRAAGEFLESAEVHGNWYGTLLEEVETRILAGIDVLLDIDVQGARQVRSNLAGTALASSATFVFFGPPSLAELERRLRDRGSETEDAITRRLANARDEMAAWQEYDFLIINETVVTAAGELRAILIASHCAVKQSVPNWAL